jgi:RHS repeat-associated protein
MLGNLGYQSEWTDAFTGRVNMFSRWYNTRTGQFDTRDTADNNPIPDSINANRYQYSDGNPLTVTDPTGHWGIPNPIKKLVKKGVSLVKKGAKAVYHGAKHVFYDLPKRVLSSTIHHAKKALHHALQKAKHLVHEAKKKYHAVKKWVGHKTHQIVHYAKKKYTAAKHWVAKKYNAAKHYVKQKAKSVKKWVSKKYHQAKTKVKKYYRIAKQAATHVVYKTARVVSKGVHTVKDGYKKTTHWIKEHKAEIAGFVVGAVVGIGCGAAIGWTGVGAVACGAAAGAAGSLVTGAMKGHRGMSLAKDTFIGAAVGGITGGLFSIGGAAAGSGVRSVAAGGGARAALGAASSAGRAEAANIGRGLAGRGLASRGLGGSGGSAATRAQHDFVAGPKGAVKDVRGKGRPDGQLVISGHGTIREGDGATVTIPKGTCLVFYCKHDDGISDFLGNQIETGNPKAYESFGPGSKVPDYILGWPKGLNIKGAPITVTDGKAVRLSDVLQPNRGICHWAACRDVIS